MQKVLEIKNITKIYKIYKSNFDRLKEAFSKKTFHKEFIANKNISFDLKEGETLGIVGLNGAGKSTILKIIAGVIEPTDGEVIRHGRVTALLELGTGFNPQMSGYDNIHLNATLIGMDKSEIKEKLDDIIGFSELGDYIYEPITSYSSGMIMRLAFSIAIFSNPKILIVDEALSVGDAHFSAKCTRALKERKKQNMSIIYVSHDLNSLKVLCDRVILLSKGEVVDDGEPETVINNYNFLISQINDTKNKFVIKSNTTNSFGTYEIEIQSVAVIGEKSKSNTISSGEKATIRLSLFSQKDFKNMTIGIMIRDRFGQDIFGTNTFFYDKKIDFKENCRYICEFVADINLGIGKYTVTAAVHSNNSHLENCLHWIDKATDFEIIGNLDYYFIGVCKLYPSITFKKEMI